MRVFTALCLATRVKNGNVRSAAASSKCRVRYMRLWCEVGNKWNSLQASESELSQVASLHLRLCHAFCLVFSRIWQWRCQAVKTDRSLQSHYECRAGQGSFDTVLHPEPAHSISTGDSQGLGLSARSLTWHALARHWHLIAYKRSWSSLRPHDEQGVNPVQIRGFDGDFYKLWPLLMPWLAASRCQPRLSESRSR